MVSKIKHWADVCKLHWKEIVTLSVALHTIVDLIIWPTLFALGIALGMHIEGGKH